MTLRALAKFSGIEPENGQDGPSPDVTLAFALDAGYLELFKVCLRSLILSGNFLDCPIVLYTDDPSLGDDPVVQAAADRVALLQGARKELIYGLARDSVRHRDRSSWNKGTFLKWCVFEKQETSRLVFLDVDMIFLRRFDHKLLEQATAPFSCCPQFRQSMIKQDDGDIRSVEERLTEFGTALSGNFEGKLQTNVNSGMMVLGSEMLSPDFFAEITAHAAAGREINEQSHFSSYFLKRPEILKMLPVAFNFQESYLVRMPWEHQQALLKRIHVLHYAGRPKPWQRPPRRADFRPSTALWHWHRTLAAPLL